MEKQMIQEQIKSLETKRETIDKELKELKADLVEQSNKNEWIYIEEQDLEIEKSIHHKGKSYDELVEEFGKEYLEEHLPTYALLQLLRNLAFKEKKYVELGLLNTWEFVKQEDEISKQNGYVARFVAYPDIAGLVCRYDSNIAYSSLGVRFVRKKFLGTTKK